MKLLSKSAFAAQCGVSAPAISKLVRFGKLTIVDGQVDLEGDDTVEYLRKRGEVSNGERLNKNHGGGRPTITSQDERPPESQLPIESPKSGGVSRSVIDLAIAQQKLFAAQMKNKKEVGELLMRAWFHRGIWQPINTQWERMLTDLPRNLIGQLHPLILGGMTKEEGEDFLRKQMSSVIQGAKDSCKRAMDNVGA